MSLAACGSGRCGVWEWIPPTVVRQNPPGVTYSEWRVQPWSTLMEEVAAYCTDAASFAGWLLPGGEGAAAGSAGAWAHDVTWASARGTPAGEQMRGGGVGAATLQARATDRVEVQLARGRWDREAWGRGRRACGGTC